MKIQGAEGMSAENIRDEINRGARVVGYLYCVSVVLMTFKRGTDLRLIKPGHSAAAASWPYTLLTLVLGWWGFPWGPIYSIECLYKNLSGGVDVTDDILRAVTPAPAAASATATSVSSAATPPPLTMPAPAAPRGFNWKAAGLMAGGASLLVIVGVTGYCFYHQQNLTVVLANGLDRPYAVVLNGETHTLRAHGAEMLTLPEGEFTLADAPGSHVVGESQKLRFEIPFFDHLETDKVAIINPDRCAILIDDEVHYYASTATPPASQAPVYTLFANQLSHFIAKPDYVIEPAATSISMPSGTSRVVKHRLELAQPITLSSTLGVLEAKLGYDGVRDHLRLLARQRNDEPLLQTAVGSLHSDDLRALLESRLDERPVAVEWHRYYQNTMQRLFPAEDLEPRYRRYVAAHPEEGALHYLLGRVLDDDAQPPLWRAALAAPSPCAYAHAAIGYDALSEGRFADALAAYDAAKHASVESGGVRHYRQLAYLALGRTAEILPELEAERQKEPFNIELTGREIRYAITAANLAEANRIRADYLKKLSANEASPAQLADAQAFLDAEKSYPSGDLAAYAKALERFPQPFYAFRVAYVRGDLAAAGKIAEKDFAKDVQTHLLLYILAEQQKNASAADRHFAAALAAMPTDDADLRPIAAALGLPHPDAQALCRRHLMLETKRILLTALGLRFPQDRATYFTAARQLNFLPEFPQRTLAAVMAD